MLAGRQFAWLHTEEQTKEHQAAEEQAAEKQAEEHAAEEQAATVYLDVALVVDPRHAAGDARQQHGRDADPRVEAVPKAAAGA